MVGSTDKNDSGRIKVEGWWKRRVDLDSEKSLKVDLREGDRAFCEKIERDTAE